MPLHVRKNHDTGRYQAVYGPERGKISNLNGYFDAAFNKNVEKNAELTEFDKGKQFLKRLNQTACLYCGAKLPGEGKPVNRAEQVITVEMDYPNGSYPVSFNCTCYQGDLAVKNIRAMLPDYPLKCCLVKLTTHEPVPVYDASLCPLEAPTLQRPRFKCEQMIASNACPKFAKADCPEPKLLPGGYRKDLDD